MSIGEVATELGSAASDVAASAARTVRASHDLEEASASVARLTHGTTASEPPATIAAWDSAAEHARRAAELLHAGNASVAAYLKAIGSGAGNPLAEAIKSGADLLEDSDGGSGFHRARQSLVSQADGVGQRVAKVIKLNQALAKKPAGQPRTETRPPSSVDSAPKDLPVENAFAAIVVTAVVIPHAIHWAVTRLWRRIRNGQGS